MREKSYRGYIAEVMRLIGENVASITGGSYITSKWVDLLDRKPEDDRTADEIALDVITRAGLSFGGEAE